VKGRPPAGAVRTEAALALRTATGAEEARAPLTAPELEDVDELDRFVEP
jgi:hypothetical protein